MMPTEITTAIGTWIAGGIVSLLVFLVSFFFYRAISAFDKLEKSVDSLQKSISGMNAIILLLQDKESDIIEQCKTRHELIDSRLKEYAKDIEAGKLEIAVLKVT